MPKLPILVIRYGHFFNLEKHRFKKYRSSQRHINKNECIGDKDMAIDEKYFSQKRIIF